MIIHCLSKSSFPRSSPVWVLGLIILLVSLTSCHRSADSPVPVVPPSKTPAQERSNPWVLIDSKSEVATVYKDGKSIAVLDKLAFGAAGVKEKVRQGDDVTPVGCFTVTHVSYQSKYGVFVGLNYPRVSDAERGLNSGIINRSTYDRILRAHKDGRDPPQDTKLGGLIGIHGVGRGSLDIHHLANWTAGCIAMDNNQIREFAKLVKRGTQVEIR